MTVTLRDIIRSLPSAKRQSDTLWAKILIRPLSYLVAWGALRLGMTAYQVSLLSILFPVLALGLWLTQHPLTAIILLNIWLLLDCTDGNLARVLGPKTYGDFVDAASGYVMLALVFLGVGLYLDLFATGALFTAPWFTFFGALTSLFSLTSRIFFQKFQNTNYRMGAPVDTPSKQGFVKMTDRNLGIGGFLTPSLFLAYFFNGLEWWLFFYCFYNGIVFLYTTYRLLWKARF
jgi:phosphatidylglycerophosphate synthase